MSIKEFAYPNRIHRNPATQRRNGLGELDVFEATRYFSGFNEVSGPNNGLLANKAMREGGGRRMSLDMPATLGTLPLQSYRVEKETKEKKHKQPSSPGGRLASFLNSLFHQTSSRKKKSKSTQSMKDEQESPGGRRNRRSSISLFQSNSKSVYATSTASGFRTPPPYLDTPTKGYLDQKHVSLPKYSEKVKSVSARDELAWLDEKFKFLEEYADKEKNMYNKGRKYSLEKKNVVKRVVEMDDGGESDSSSDLFELEIKGLGVYSDDLPVYETTHMESIKRSAQFTNGPL